MTKENKMMVSGWTKRDWRHIRRKIEREWKEEEFEEIHWEAGKVSDESHNLTKIGSIPVPETSCSC